MAEHSFTLQNVEDEIVKRLGESTAQTMINEGNEDRVIPLFWQSVTDIIISSDYKEEDVAGLIDEKKEQIGGVVDGIGEIELKAIEDNDSDTYSLLRYHDIYSTPGDTDYMQKVIKLKSLNFIKQILGGDPRSSGEVYVYKVANTLKFFKDSSNDVVDKYVNVVYVKSPDPQDGTGDVPNLLTIYSLGFIYKAIDLTVNKIKKERQ